MVTAGVGIVQICFPEKRLQVYGAWRVKIFRNERVKKSRLPGRTEGERRELSRAGNTELRSSTGW